MSKARKSREEYIAEYQESGLSQKAYCEESGISVSTLGYWLRHTKEKVKRAGSEKRLVPINLGSLEASKGVEIKISRSGEINITIQGK
ncbi:IS66 family insertion sequence element accessory protein TnpA [Leptospira inadai]|uniref:Transposase n=1 Tax=Leptospira inadai serovar Lyme TaxID=293084 RepID=A0ABX4YLU4_9LEPT|nr:hypothetical protein [Leptospira inadai]PNV74134.1 hypothetical protein BES34_014850 [Leptospira inadai serovar Lyme]PNV76233.1 hypothetical protein BES34_004305 [Leptospira inadai serovar Lyme]